MLVFVVAGAFCSSVYSELLTAASKPRLVLIIKAFGPRAIDDLLSIEFFRLELHLRFIEGLRHVVVFESQ